MPQKTMNKSQSERAHFKRRLRERYGININRFGYFSLVDQVKHKKSECLMLQTNTRTIHRVRLAPEFLNDQTPKVPCNDEGLDILVVYDKLRGELVTALKYDLTPEEIAKYHGD